jgi:ubiquinone/menaquinone biosynthesis C-methylase UbiE
MAEVAIDFDDSAAYERAMGRWSRAVAPDFLQWLAPPAGARWLDVGCGTGILAHALLELSSPAAVVGIDPQGAQIAEASRGPAAGRVAFQVADARRLPFQDASFDITASALVLNFIAERAQSLTEMRRVTRAGGHVAAYVWDFPNELSPSGPLRRTLKRFGFDVPDIPGTRESDFKGLRTLFEQAGLERIETRTVDVCLAYQDFEDFWHAQTPSYSPTTKIIARLTERERIRVMRAVRAQLPEGPGGIVEYFARANAVKARVPCLMPDQLQHEPT